VQACGGLCQSKARSYLHADGAADGYGDAACQPGGAEPARVASPAGGEVIRDATYRLFSRADTNAKVPWKKSSYHWPQ
jgi:hypothetical protein